ncbi:DegT/DnrJ/EryC1/StrS family aminotransferase [Actinomycetospora aeridis]|uniref:DegT/DnrJ/EryC1/StrS family aminotransferase n=1 Tax=Actinomycetospora aeridis TaxID=3129231 RepID=A0ABU8N6T8_9PSEU
MTIADAGTVPLVDLAAQHHEIADEVAAGWADVVARSAFVGGPEVAAFETEFAGFSGVRRCVGVANGTDAIELALRGLGVGPGDECLLPANTFIATAEAIVRAGATPVLVDCRDDTALIDVDAVAAAAGPRTRAVLPVHLWGQTASVDELRRVLPDRVLLVEDAAQAQGATRHGQVAGGLGDAAATSFYPGKNLGAYGDGGAVLTDDEAVADRVRLLGAHGSSSKYRHEVIGWNSRLDTLQAVVLRAKLRRLARWNDERRRAAARYDALLADVPGVVRPVVAPGNHPVWHLYVVRVPERDRVHDALRDAGVGVGVHYPAPLHLTGAFAHLGRGPGSFPVAERLAGEILSLPLYPGITDGQQDRVASELAAAAGR